MLIINGDRPMSGAEHHVLSKLKALPGPGIALSGYHVPDRSGRSSQEVDVILITPESAVCIEIKGIVKFGISGTLSCPVNGRWNLPGIEGDPIHVRGNDTNPLEQVGSGMFNLKNLAEAATGTEVFVPGLVVVVANKGTITLDKGPVPMPTGRDVLLADNLASWLTATRRRPPVWTAESVLALTDALALDEDTVTLDDLTEAGFPTQSSTRPADNGVVVDLFPATPQPQAPGPAADQPRANPRRRAEDLGRTEDDLAYLALNPPAMESGTGTGRRAPVRSAVLAGAAVCLLGGGIWVIATAAGHAAHHDSGQSTSTVVGSRTAPPSGTPAAVTPPAAPPAGPAPLFTVPVDTKPPCYPFQAGC